MNCPKVQTLFNKIRTTLEPPPDLTMSEWADTYRRLPESSENSGRWKTSYTEYMREIMDCISDPRVETVVIMSSAQVGKTELVINTIGYFAHQKPVPMLVVQPTIDLAESFSKERIQPTIDTTPELCEIFGDRKSRSSDNTIRQKMFPGGFLSFSGSNAPSSLASRAVGVALFDEVDRYPPNSGGEGDVIALGIKRTTTYRNRKIVIVSTPTDAATSRIALAYENTTQEKYHLFCPACDKDQQIKHEHIEVLEKENNLPIKVGATCGNCGVVSLEHEWKKKKGIWIGTKSHPSARGFHLNEWVSPWKRWEKIEQEFVEAQKDTETLRVWINTSAGEVYEEKGDTIRWEDVAARAYHWDDDVPDDVLYITAGVDVQDDRLAVEIVGYTLTNEDYSIDYEHILGDTNKKEVWKELDDFLQKEYELKSGESLKVSAACIDSGGHSTQSVYEFCKKNRSKNYMAIKGRGGWGIPFTSKPKKVKLKRGGHVPLFMLGVDDGKVRILNKLRNEEKGSDYCHFPITREDWYFKELTAEKLVSRMKQGRPEKKWIPVRRRNEAFDCRNYANAAFEIQKPNLEQIQKVRSQPDVKVEVEQPKYKRPRKRLKKKGYLDI